jgi:mannosyl-oligosaccharide alpha-1,2-mannosidase
MKSFRQKTSILRPIQIHETSEHTELLEQRRQSVKAAFLHGWQGYKKYAFGFDELKPLTNRSHNPFGGLGATIIDSLSTMLVMDLQDEVQQLLPWIESLNVTVNVPINVFETTIRCMGGLLSAYELSQHEVFLKKAEEIGQALLPAFDTPFGIPYYHFNPHNQTGTSNTTYLADAGTVQLELLTLSRHTGNPVFAEKAQAITQFFETIKPIPGMSGLFPTDIDLWRGAFKTSDISFGAMGDSAYEYFLKEHILTGGNLPQYAQLYKNAIDSMKKNMLFQTVNSTNLYLPTYNLKTNKRNLKMDHLTCFVPGMLAIGSKVFDRPEDLEIARRLLDTCVTMYRTTPTGLSPEVWTIKNPIPFNTTQRLWWNPFATQNSSMPAYSEDMIRRTIQIPSDMQAYDTRYLLRPETLESLFVLYRITGETKYQEYGWDIFQAIEKHCKTPSAFASVKNIYAARKKASFNQIDSMETFLFAETFKYLYLLFSPTDLISLDKYVLNTEAHPLLIPNTIKVI